MSGNFKKAEGSDLDLLIGILLFTDIKFSNYIF
jgi:hypothetical protein